MCDMSLERLSRAWDNVTHQFIPMYKSYLILKLFIHCNEVIKGFMLWTWVGIVANVS
jgi:hypothetical protein